MADHRRVLAERSILGFRNNGLRAIGIATLIAIASISVHTAPVAAADPTPTADPAASPTEFPTPVDASPSPTADPALVEASPAASPTETPIPVEESPSPTADPATASPTEAPAALAAPPADPAISTPTEAPAATVVVQSAIVSTVARPAVKVSEGARVVRIAMAQRGKRYASGSTGPRAFDCSGLVWYSYRIAGVSRHIGGGHSARGMYTWARMHGLTSRSNPQIGDIAIYGNGTHAAIYIGHGRVVSALNPRVGIRVTSLHALTAPFTTFIHTHI